MALFVHIWHDQTVQYDKQGSSGDNSKLWIPPFVFVIQDSIKWSSWDRGPFHNKYHLSRYRNPHRKNGIVLRSSFLYDENPYPHRWHLCHDAVIKWKHFPRYWPFVWGIHRSPVNSPHKGQWRGYLIFSLICAWINGWINIFEIWDPIALTMTSV